MRKIKIAQENTDKINAAIKEAEGRATARTVSVEDIVKALAKIKVPKSKLNGTVVRWDGAEHFPNAYKYRPESTHWVAENVNGRWYLVNVFRDTCPNRTTWRMQIDYGEEAISWILDHEKYVW